MDYRKEPIPMTFIWEAIAILIIGFILIRIAGKKTVSEMTGLEMITLISVASIMGHAISEQEWWKTALVMSIFVTLLILVQYLSLKFDLAERLMIGKATVVIRDGKIVESGLKKLRMTIDQLEVRIREKGIQSISDIKTGTIEVNGGLGYELMRHARPLTIGDLERMLHLSHSRSDEDQKENIFKEVREKHER
jgi:uncharacterized membrane protein YcaP (DUF421 family)